MTKALEPTVFLRSRYDSACHIVGQAKEALRAALAMLAGTTVLLATTIALLAGTTAVTPTTTAQLAGTTAQLAGTTAQLPATMAQLAGTMAQLPTKKEMVPASPLFAVRVGPHALRRDRFTLTNGFSVFSSCPLRRAPSPLNLTRLRQR